MLQIVRVTRDSEDLEQVKALYERAFPENERRDFRSVLTHCEEYGDNFEIEAVYDGELLVGFVVVLIAGDISHILYFAVEEALRSKGYGGRILQALQDSKPDQRIIVDVEKPDAMSDNREQREKRLRFYERNGFKRTKVEYRWHDEDYWILSGKGDVSEEEYWAFEKLYGELLKKMDEAEQSAV